MTRGAVRRAAERVHDYARKVLSGEIVAGPYVRAACERHRRDLERSDIRFDAEKCAVAVAFFETVLTLSGGQWEGRPFKLEPWEAFVVGSVWGWRLPDGMRRFRRVYMEVAKGNGKSPVASGLALAATVLDQEQRSEGFVLARTGEQALVPFKMLIAQIRGSAELNEAMEVYGGEVKPTEVLYPGTNSFIRRVGSDAQARGKSGPSPHIVLVDEYHEHNTSGMLDWYAAGVKSRSQPLIVIATNSGSGQNSPCKQEHDVAVKVAHGDIERDSYFAYVCGLDDGDDPEDEAVWVKANPSLPVTPGYDYIRDQLKDARAIPAKMSTFLRLNMCVWMDAESPWLSRDTWVAAERRELPGAIRDAPCYVGLDLSLKRDLTAAALVWDLGKDGWAVRAMVWTPKDTLEARAREDSAPYIEWVRGGYMEAIPGSFVNYRVIAKWLLRMMDRYDLRGLAYDPQYLDLLEEALADLGVPTYRGARGRGLRMVPHQQGFRAGPPSGRKREGGPHMYMPRSIEAVEEALLTGSLAVEYSPPLRWAALGTVAIQDESMNRRLAKGKSLSKIDPMVAFTMAMGLAKAGLAKKSRRVRDYMILPEEYRL